MNVLRDTNKCKPVELSNAKLQKTRREGLLMQLKQLGFLTNQGIAIQGHHESEGNLQQLLITWSENNESIKNWIKKNRLTSVSSASQ